jgi:hypothetical protein
VTPAALTITTNNQSKVYGAALPTLTASYTGLVNGDTAASLTTGPTLTTTATAASHVGAGPYAITASGAVDSDYAISYVGGSLSVTTAPLTITANNQSKVYGAALPGLTASINGFVNGDTAASLTTGPTLTTTATAASHVAGGPYAITASGAVNSDYKISYVAGTLAVTAAALTITADSKTMTYRDALPALTATYSGFVNGDGTGSLTTAPVLASATPATANAGTYNGTLTARGAVDGDYAISFAAGNLVIGQRAITVTADPQSRVQSDPNPLLTFQVGGRGLITGDTLSGGLATSATTQSVVGIYAITQGTLAASSNYMLSYIGADLTVTSVPSTVVNPVTVAGSQFQPPANASISLVTPPVAPAPLLAFTRSAPITNAAGDKKNTDVVTSSVDVFAPSADGLVYPPISQYDPGQYAGDKLPDHVEQAGLATILTMIARAAAHEITPPVTPPTIDQLFDPAKGADWHGVGWQNPLVDKVNFAADPQGSEPGFATALPLDGKTDIGALLGHGPVILAGANDTWLLAVAITEGGIVADDPVTGTRVLLAYDPVTKTIGSIGKIFDSAGNKWIARGDAGKAGIEFVDDAKLAALQTFETEKYLTVTLVK